MNVLQGAGVTRMDEKRLYSNVSPIQHRNLK